MMTTDTVPKMAHAEVSLKGGDVQIAGMTKGSGMIHPNMATTLGFVMTDAAISPIHLRQMLVNTVESTFNRSQRRRRHVHERHRCPAGKRRVRHPPVGARAPNDGRIAVPGDGRSRPSRSLVTAKARPN